MKYKTKDNLITLGLAILLILSIIVVIGIIMDAGKDSVRQEAVDNGHATWVVKEGSKFTSFEWNNLTHEQ